MTEPVLKEEIDRFVVLPVNSAYQDLWDMYKYHQKMFWVAEEIDYPADKNDWESLSDDERFFIKRILAFFAGSDGIVIENLVTNFCNEVKISEARAFYTFQAAM
jgi:ribonucleotide reductase beta subunit family protein with ferritin-like domain